jgi:hypothetical protein
MVQPTQWDREFIRDLAAKGSCLGVANMVGLAGLPSTNRTGLKRNGPKMVFIPSARWFHERNPLAIFSKCFPTISLGRCSNLELTAR